MDGVAAPHAQDSFFTLTTAGQVGLAALSLGLATGVIVLVWFVTRGRATTLRGITALALFWVFLWLSPQVYYAYYGFIFKDLPTQWVISTPPSPLDVLYLLGFADRATLSSHGQGVLGWVILIVALGPQRNPARI